MKKLRFSLLNDNSSAIYFELDQVINTYAEQIQKENGCSQEEALAISKEKLSTRKSIYNIFVKEIVMPWFIDSYGTFENLDGFDSCDVMDFFMSADMNVSKLKVFSYDNGKEVIYP